jgi:hypothetical protein
LLLEFRISRLRRSARELEGLTSVRAEIDGLVQEAAATARCRTQADAADVHGMQSSRRLQQHA